jgi:hypothetical protein
MTTAPLPGTVDDLHVPDTEDPWITETAWYSFWTTGGEYAAHVYLRFRPNLGIANPCVYVWGEGTSVEWDAAYWKHSHFPMPASLASMELLGGLRHEAVEPFGTYRISYADNEKYGAPLYLAAEFTALGPPEFLGRKHFDQPVHVTGTLGVDGTEYDVDCLAMRDRSWYSRGDYTLFRSAYSYAITAPDEQLLAIFAAPRDCDMLVDDLPTAGGYLESGRAGAPSRRDPLTSGTRRVIRREDFTGHPLEVVVEVGGPAGQERMTGRVRNCMAVAANPNMLSWMSLVEWEVGGRTVWGEDQEIWSPSIWRAFRRGHEHVAH